MAEPGIGDEIELVDRGMSVALALGVDHAKQIIAPVRQMAPAAIAQGHRWIAQEFLREGGDCGELRLYVTEPQKVFEASQMASRAE